MPKAPGPMSGPRVPAAKGKNGPTDKNGGTKHYSHPALPKVGTGQMTGTKSK